MPLRPTVLIAIVSMVATLTGRRAPVPAKAMGCRRAVIVGELNAGQPFEQGLGGGLKVYFQPIHSGWILRVLPVSGPAPAHDYAELATPPYQSVTPLSISTDFAFRAQDAIGWNPRRFRFATSAGSFRALDEAYARYEKASGSRPDAAPVSAEIQAELGAQIARSSEGSLTILDARLVPGTADQWRMASAVASHFASTAHTIVQERDGSISALGRVLWLRFRLEMDLPQGFTANPDVHLERRICANP